MKLRTLILALLAGIGTESILAQKTDLAVSPSVEGINITAGCMGKFCIKVPRLAVKPNDIYGEKPIRQELQGDMIVANYPNGATLRITVSKADKSATFSYEGVPEGAKGFVAEMLLPINLASGGRFAFNQDPLMPFPESKENRIVADKVAPTLTVVSPLDEGFTIQIPQDQQVVMDKRFENWPAFIYTFNYTFKEHVGQNQFILKLTPYECAATEGVERKFLVTKFGQSNRKDFPSKVKDEEELRADIAKQKAALPKFDTSSLDLYGGLAGSGAQYHLEKTGFFHVGNAGGRKVLVTPEGNAFFQLAVCSVKGEDYTVVAGRERIYEWIPPKDGQFASTWHPRVPGAVSFYLANWIRKFGKPFSPEEWSSQALERLRAWGFNSTGAWSQQTDVLNAAKFPYVAFLPLERKDGLATIGKNQILDPFAPGQEAKLEKVFASTIAKDASDPLLIGYFLGNEQPFIGVPYVIPTSKASEIPAKQGLIDMLQEKYGDIANFNAAWNPAKPFASFDELKEQPLVVRGEAATADMKAFYRLYLENYYAMVERVFRKYDPNHLLIGNRWTPQAAANKDLVEIGGRHLDVISINNYTYNLEKSFLKNAYEWSGEKPIILSEWHYGTRDQGLGGSIEVRDQRERGAAYRHYLEQAAATPYVVGSQWFIYLDQPITGRYFEGFNGEGYGIGFVNVADRPYDELVEAARKTHAVIYDVVFGKLAPFVFDDPRFTGDGKGGSGKIVTIPKALPGMKFDGSAINWPGRPATPISSNSIVSGTANPDLRGDFRVCWDEKALHFLIQVKDKSPMMNEKEPQWLGNADCVEVFIAANSIKEGGAMLASDRQILLGAGKEPKIFIPDHANESAQCNSLVIRNVTGDGYVLEALIPWKLLGIAPSSGMELLFDVGIDNSDDGKVRIQQLMWNGTAKNSRERGSWGHARLVEN